MEILRYGRQECLHYFTATTDSMNDFKFAFRQLLKNPGFTAVAMLTLALGIGASTALFSVVYGVVISPYPYARPQEIWMPGLRTSKDDQRMRPYRPDDFKEMARLSSFADVMATRPGSMLLGGEYAPETVRAVEVTANAFNFLAVPPLLGRTIQPSDVQPSGEPEQVAVLSFGRWQKLFANDTNALGKPCALMTGSTPSLASCLPGSAGGRMTEFGFPWICGPRRSEAFFPWPGLSPMFRPPPLGSNSMTCSSRWPGKTQVVFRPTTSPLL